jgi:hypothetical protein
MASQRFLQIPSRGDQHLNLSAFSSNKKVYTVQETARRALQQFMNL